MYNIKNISTKIINIGTTVLMPDQTMKVSDAMATAPSIKTFASMGLLTVNEIVTAKAPEAPAGDQKNADGDEDQAAENGDEDQAAENGEDAQPEAPAGKPKGTRRTTRKPAEATE